MISRLLHLFSKHKYLLLVLFLFGTLFTSISIVNHYLFRTSAHDLGIYVNAMYDYNHFQKNTSTIFITPSFVNSLNDHFELLPMLWSPFHYIFGTYTLLIIQIISILFGSIGIYKLVHRKTGNHTLSLLASVHFLSIWGIYSALAFDYHNNVIAAMLVPWLMYYFDKAKWVQASVFLLLILVAKENMALWAVFIGLGLLLMYRKDAPKLKMSIALSVLSALYFVVVMKFIMPALGIANDTYNHFHYTALGSSMREAVSKLVFHPIDSFFLLFENHTHEKVSVGIKTELHLMVLLSGGWVLLFRPQYLIMLIPIYAQKLFNDDFGKWGINAHYSIEFVPVLTLALFDVIASMNDKTINKNLGFLKINAEVHYIKNISLYVAIMSCLLTFAATIWKMDSRTSKWYKAEKQRFYDTRHYKVDFNAAEVHKALELIPKKAIVSAQTNLSSHLAFRDTIYLFPAVNNAQYIALLNNGVFYPAGKEIFEAEREKYTSSNDWQVIYNQHNTLILKKH